MDASGITWITFVASAAVAATLIVLVIVRAARSKAEDGGKRKVGRGTIVALVLAVLIAATNLGINRYSNIINQHFSSANVDDASLDETTKASQNVSTDIEGEGIVLLKNSDDALPLAGTTRVNVFGISSQRLVYGGSGSGASDESSNVSLSEGLSQAGIETNEELGQFYADNLPKKSSADIFSLKGGDYNIYEPSVDKYSDSLITDAKSYSDTALVVFSRSGGEGGDLPLDMAGYEGGDPGKNYLELQDTEIALLDMVEENFDNVIVIINSSNAMELGFLEDDGVDAALWIGGPGSTGCTAVGSILTGAVDPSGRLTDTYAYDVASSPAYYNAGDFTYTQNGEKTDHHYVEYAEGIYVGYRYYETASEDGYIDYSSTVQYPFGYGLSYTTFDQSISSHTENDGTITVAVDVTNTGSVAGKDVVQVYFSAPYTKGGVEKSSIELAGLAKTDALNPGETQTVRVSFSVEDMASFDYTSSGAYVLDAGDYQIRLMENSHDEIGSFTYAVSETITYGEGNARISDRIAATTAFPEAKGDVTYVSRADWAGTMPTEHVDTQEATDELISELDADNATALYCSDNPDANVVTVGKDSGLSLEDMVDVAFDDERWDVLVQQMSVDDMGKLIGYGGFSTVAVGSVGKAATVDIDGPAGLNALTSDISGVQYSSEVVLASTWNVGLIEKMGETYAAEASAHGVNGVYAPAANIHRTPFSGRNFEYYSEDPLLSGKIGAAEVKGINTVGICTYVKHFILNDQETNRSGMSVWANEQAIREIYLKPFEIMVKEGGTSAVMTSYNRIGTVWTGGDKALINEVLRGEWGFDGVVITDYDNGGYMNVDQAIRAGGDLMLSTLGDAPTEVTTDSSYGVSLMQQSCKRILYMVVNSRAYTNPVSTTFPAWLAVLVGVDMASLGLLCLVVIKGDRSKKDEKKVA